jgi:hypothetical protein
MPKQSRGFWVCSICSQAFDQFEEANYHELHLCPLRYSLQPVGDQSSRQLKRVEQEPYVMAPLAHVTSVPPSKHARKPSSSSFSFEYKSETRILPLLGSNESCNLDESDAIICRSLEFFETNEFSERGRLLNQVGIRCSHCASSVSEAFPQSINHISYCIRQLAKQHLTSCRSCPPVSREAIKRFVKQRQFTSAQTEADRDQKLLNEFSINRCKKFGITNRTPRNSGIMMEFGSAAISQSQIAPMSPSHTRRSSPLPTATVPTGLHYDERSQLVPYHAPPYHQAMQFDALTEQLSQSNYVPFVPGYIVPPDFPFIQEMAGEWICKFCCNVHPNMRDPKFYWMAPDRSPPPPDFIDHHLSACRAFQEAQFGAFEYQAVPQSIHDDSHPTSLTAPYRWDSGYEIDQTMLPTNVAPNHAFETNTDIQSYESLQYNRRSNEPSVGFSVSSPHRPAFAPSVTLDTAESSDDYKRAMEYLSGTDLSGENVTDESSLVVGEDKLLLTDYFYFIMKQLSPVRFSEADRRTRGGKRENIAVGYGGLQCIHCAENPNPRKFFWSNVDRLANSFAEIPSHVLKCRRCPQSTKDALLLMKKRHPDQMSRLPRGSQKVFFRRMWRRLHDEDPIPTDDILSPIPSIDSQNEGDQLPDSSKQTRPNPVDTSSFLEGSPAGTSGSEESMVIPQRSTEEAAKALAGASMQSGPPSPFSRVLLAIPDDNKWLSDTDCFIRRQLEVFCATTEDVDNAHTDRKYPIEEGQVGIRCLHCAVSKTGARGQGVAYPFNVSGIYESAREMQRLHLELCEHMPAAAKAKYDKLKGSSSLSSVLRKYYIIAATAIGLIDTMNGIRAGGKSVPILPQVAFAFSEDASPRGDSRGKDDKHSPDSVSTRSALSQRFAEGKQNEEPNSPFENTASRKRSAENDDNSSSGPDAKRHAYSAAGRDA